MDTQTQIDRLIELAIIQRSELKQLVEQLPQLRDHLNAEVEKVFDETEPQLRAELEEWTTKQTADKTAALGVALEAKIADLAKSLEVSTQARYNAIIAERAENARLAAQAEAKIAEHAASLPSAVKDIVTAELARFPRAGEIDQLRKEFAEPRGLNPRGKWQAGETYNKLDLVTINGDSYTSNTDGNRTRPSRSSADWTLVAARGTGGGGGPTSLSELTTVPSDGDLLIGSGTSWVTSNLTAGAGISITVGPGAITISATDGDITLDDGTAASPSLHFTNDADTGIYRPAANTLGISTSGVQRMYVDQNGITTVGAGGTFDGSVHAANGNANNPSFSFSGDQDTGFFRHQPNEIGVSLGGTQYATLTSTTFSITPNLVVSGTGSINGTTIPASKTLVVTTDKLSALASTSSAELAGVISDETGTGALVFANTPTLVTPNIGAATGTSVNLSGAGTFGGNLTVSGGTLAVTPSANDATATLKGRATGTNQLATSSRGSNVTLVNLDTTDNNCEAIAFQNSNELAIASIVAQNVSHTGRTGKLYVNISNGAAPAEALNIAADKTVTLAGNLTVSGTGTSSFGGKIQSSAATATGYNQLYDTTGITTGRGAFAITSTGAGLALGIEASVGGTSFTGSTAYASYFGTTTATPIHFITNAAISATLTSGGNLGIGTTDIQGKLHVRGSQADPLLRLGYEVAGQSYLDFLRTSVDAVPVIQSGYGVDGSFALAINPSGGNLLIGTTSDTGQKLQVKGGTRITDSASASNYITIGSGNDAPYGGNSVVAQTGTLVVGTVAAASLFLFTNGTTALTLDSSQNATFAGTSVTVDGASTGSTLTLKRASNANGAIISYKTTTTSKWYHGLRGLVDDNWYLQNDVAGNTALFFDASTSNATFAGKIISGGAGSTYQLNVRGIGYFDRASGSAVYVDPGASSGGMGTANNYPLIITSNSTSAITISTAQALRFHAYGAGTLTTDASGNVTASSDARLKTNLRTFARGLTDVLKLSPKTYNWNETSGLETEHDYVGFVAQDVANAIPEAVYESKDANKTLTLNDRAILAALVNAVKELNAKLA